MIVDVAKAIVAALLPLRGDPTSESAPVRMVSHWNGDLDGVDIINRAILTQSPALLVALSELESDSPDEHSVDVRAYVETVSTLRFSVFVVVSDVRPPNVAATARTAASASAYHVADLVAGALNNLDFVGGWQDQPLRVTRVQPYFASPGVAYVLNVVVSARVQLPDAETPVAFAGEQTELDDLATKVVRAGTYDDGTDVVVAERTRVEFTATPEDD